MLDRCTQDTCQFFHDKKEVFGHHCIYHLPENITIHNLLYKSKKDWDQNQVKSFNSRIFNIVNKAIAIKKSVNLKHVIFPGAIDFSNYTKGNELPEITFESAMFVRNANFSNVVFSKKVSFERALFRDNAIFSAAHFGGNGYFQNASFKGQAFFEMISINESDTVSFENSEFNHGATFNNANFGITVFTRATFGGNAYFKNACFRESVSFYSARFARRLDTIKPVASFSGATFFKTATFSEVNFPYTTSFKGAKFIQHANFSAKKNSSQEKPFEVLIFTGARFTSSDYNVSFEGRGFIGRTDFRNALFKSAPNFHNCEFYPDTDFSGANFGGTKQLGAAGRYRFLKLAMENLSSHQFQMMFFAHEQESIYYDPTTPRIEKFVSYIYWLFSGYGQSILKPFLWLFGTQIFFSMLYSYSKPYATIAGYKILLMHLFRPFSFIITNDQSWPWQIYLFGFLHSVFTYTLLTLFLLAIRRKFRMQ